METTASGRESFEVRPATVVVLADYRATVARAATGAVSRPDRRTRRPLSAAAIAHRERMLRFLAGDGRSGG